MDALLQLVDGGFGVYLNLVLLLILIMDADYTGATGAHCDVNIKD